MDHTLSRTGEAVKRTNVDEKGVEPLHEMQSLTAVDRFAQLHASPAFEPGKKYYRDLIPAGPPGSGEQFAFEVDLDACSGCKSCVVACHNLNGLEEEETWRRVGLLVGGGGDELPILQHVTTACHHCVEPACAAGCPVKAYEKDEVTGIVRHLDDQCIGCQYCMLKCPYDVPVYSRSKGIVRKCDMCYQRLVEGEAPACVQACPNHAIRIRVVNQEQVRDASEVHPFLPGTPDPNYTLPTTIFRSSRVFPRNTLPADYFSIQPHHGHLPLVVMLVLTQMSVGAFGIEHAMYSCLALTLPSGEQFMRVIHLLIALLLGLGGLAASVFHLGRPQYAFRAVLGLRTSWLSREVLAFGVYAAVTTVYVIVAWFELSGMWQSAFGLLATLSGVVAVWCSVMIYVDTHRPLWTPVATATNFALTGIILGIAVTLSVCLGTATLAPGEVTGNVLHLYGEALCRLLIAAVTTKLLVDTSVLLHLRDKRHTAHKRAALLRCGELSMTMLRRVFFGGVGGVLLPLLLLNEQAFAPDGFHPLFVVVIGMLILALLIAAEMHERYLFFATSVAPRMPGGVVA